MSHYDQCILFVAGHTVAISMATSALSFASADQWSFFLFIFFNTPTISDREYYCNLCILRIFFPLASLNHSHLGSVHPLVLSSFKTYMRIFYFNQHSSYLKKSVWGGTLSLSPGLSPLSSWWWSRIFQDVGWEIMCLFYCNEVPREQEIGFACEPDFFTCSNPNSQYYYSHRVKQSGNK